MYDEKKDLYIEDYTLDINVEPFKPNVVPWLNAPQINGDISVE